jgi:cytochrome P450
MLFEEYFSEGYQNDLEEMREVVRERIETWADRESILLLDELYRIILEIRARVFFQTTFDCFDDDADVDFVGAVDRALGPEVVVMNGWSGDDVRIVHERVEAAVLGAQREGSLGAVFRDALEAGHIDRLEARDNASMYVMAQAPTMGLFWTLYRAAKSGSQSDLVDDRRELVKALKEEMRLHAPVPTMFQRVAQQDDSVGGVDVPAGTKVNLSPLFIHTNPKHWTDPYTYDRDRWQAHVGDCREVVDNKTDPADDRARPKEDGRCPHSARYIPFGEGVQICQGRWFAADEMLLVAEEILSKYELEVIEDDGLLDRPLHDQIAMHVYSRPRNDITLRPRPRKRPRAGGSR